MAARAALRLLLAGLFVSGWGVADVGTPPPLPPLPCTLLGPGGGGALPGAPTQRQVRLWLGGGPQPPPNPGVPQDLDPDANFNVTDPWGALSWVWGPPWMPPECELNPTVLVSTPPPWAPSLHPDARSPPGLEGSWWVASLGTPGYGVTALLQGQPHPPTAVTVALSVFTLTPDLGGPPGVPLELHCAFTAPPGPFALEWRHQDRGAGRRLLAYDSATSRVPVAVPGVQLLLGPSRRRGGDDGGTTATTAAAATEVTLRLDPLTVAHQGTYVCSVFLPHGQAQQLLRVRVLEPPKVTLRPTPLVVAPGTPSELRCETSGYFPLDVGVRWQRHAGDSGTPLALEDTVSETWTSGHRQGPDGTFSRSSGIRLVPARPQHHGDVYTCVVTHAALAVPLRVHVRMEVAGATGPGVEDVVGLCLVAFVLCGLWRWLSPAPLRPKQDPKKTQ
ncbi:tapasin [Grus japonensis]|uniref:Tapasin n=1 Tax=Grus japonensis TaxID=30415 RepID=A0ABC9XV59_GRUJA